MSKAVAVRTATAVTLIPLDEVVKAIKKKFNEGDKAESAAEAASDKAFDARMAAAQMLLGLRKRIEAGEAGKGVKWWDWYATQFDRGRKDSERLMRFARADDPDTALEDERAKDRERKRIARGADHTALSAPIVEAEAETPKPIGSWGVEAVGMDGRIWRDGVRLGTREEAEFHIPCVTKWKASPPPPSSGPPTRC